MLNLVNIKGLSMEYNFLKNQFIISNDKTLKTDFQNTIVLQDFYISYNKIEIINVQNAIVIGDVFSTKDSNINEDLLLLNDSNLEEITQFWAGQWVLIYKNKIYMDCFGLLGIFYAKNKEKYYISSSLYVLNKYCGFSLIADFKRRNWHDRINYFPGPQTVLQDVYKLMPNQYFDISIKKAINLSIAYNEQLDFSKNGAMIEYDYRTSNLIKNISKKYNIILELTGGIDSRTTLAVLLKNQIKFMSYSHYVPRINRYDIAIPKRLAKEYNFKHQYLKKGKFDINKEKFFDLFSFYMSNDGDRFAYSHNIKNDFTDNDIVLRSGLYEVATNFYYKSDNLIVQKDRVFNLMDLYKIFNFEKDSINDAAFEYLIQFEKNAKKSDFYNDFYYLWRDGCWGSFIVHSCNVYNTKRIQFLNCKYLIRLLFNIAGENCFSKLHQIEIMDFLVENLSKLPFNKKSLFRRIVSFFKGK